MRLLLRFLRNSFILLLLDLFLLIQVKSISYEGCNVELLSTYGSMLGKSVTQSGKRITCGALYSELRRLMMKEGGYTEGALKHMAMAGFRSGLSANTTSQFCDRFRPSISSALCLTGVPRTMNRHDVHHSFLNNLLGGWGGSMKIFAVLVDDEQVNHTEINSTLKQIRWEDEQVPFTPKETRAFELLTYYCSTNLSAVPRVWIGGEPAVTFSRGPHQALLLATLTTTT